MQITEPLGARQQTLQSTCQHVPPFADAGGAVSNAAKAVPTTAATKAMLIQRVRLRIIHLLMIRERGLPYTPTQTQRQAAHIDR